VKTFFFFQYLKTFFFQAREKSDLDNQRLAGSEVERLSLEVEQNQIWKPNQNKDSLRAVSNF